MDDKLFFDHFPTLRDLIELPYNFRYTSRVPSSSDDMLEGKFIEVKQYDNENHFNVLSLGKPISKIIDLNER